MPLKWLNPNISTINILCQLVMITGKLQIDRDPTIPEKGLSGIHSKLGGSVYIFQGSRISINVYGIYYVQHQLHLPYKIIYRNGRNIITI